MAGLPKTKAPFRAKGGKDLAPSKDSSRSEEIRSEEVLTLFAASHSPQTHGRLLPGRSLSTSGLAAPYTAVVV